MQEEEAKVGPHLTRLYRFTDGSLSELDVPTDIYIRNIFVDSLGRVWLCGVDGLIMRGRPGEGFERLDFVGDAATLISIAEFRGEMIFASDTGLHRFDGHRLTPIKPKLNPAVNNGVPTPLALFGFEAAMLYFDYRHGVCAWDGESWEWLDIPAPLLAREFAGLE